jgi:hypothetical protein
MRREKRPVAASLGRCGLDIRKRQPPADENKGLSPKQFWDRPPFTTDSTHFAISTDPNITATLPVMTTNHCFNIIADTFKKINF